MYILWEPCLLVIFLLTDASKQVVPTYNKCTMTNSACQDPFKVLPTKSSPKSLIIISLCMCSSSPLLEILHPTLGKKSTCLSDRLFHQSAKVIFFFFKVINKSSCNGYVTKSSLAQIHSKLDLRQFLVNHITKVIYAYMYSFSFAKLHFMSLNTT